MLNLSFLSCQPKKPTYDWQASVSAPEVYPSWVISGGFWAGEEDYAGLPTDGFLMEGWGETGLTMGGGKFVPEGLNITWFSVVENKFYKGEFKLPADTIRALLDEGLITSTGEHETYDIIIVNMAPGGMIVIWMEMSGERKVEIGRYQCTETNIEWKRVKPQGEQDRNTYVKKAIALFPKITENLEANGIQYGLYDSYRIKYPWTPLLVLPDSGVTEAIRISFYNGEFDFIWGDWLKKNFFKQKALPYEILLKWTDQSGSRFGADINFDEKEVFDAFKEMYKDDKTLETQLVMIPDKSNETLKIYLRSKTKEIWLRKTDNGIYPRTR
jgi:hypothetical protein